MGNRSLGFWVIAFFLLGSLIDAADSSIHEYKDEGLVKIANARYFNGGHEGLYASELLGVDASSATAPPLKGNSFIRFDDVSFVRSKESASKQNSSQASAGLVEAILFEAKQKDRVSGSFFKPQSLCCTPKLADAGSCNLGEVMISADPNDPEWPKRIHTFFKNGEEEVKMSPEAVIINKTGRWYTVYFTTCDQDLDGTVVRGRTVWKNLDRYLPGETAPLIRFYGLMFLAYAVLGLVWFPRFARNRKDGIQLRSHLSLVIAFSMYSDSAYLDSFGTIPMEVTLWVVTFSSARKAVSRLLLLALTSGYGTGKPDLSGITLRMLLLGVMCFVISLSLGLAQHFGSLSEDGMTLLMLSWAILETCFLQWIFRSLWKTLNNLKVNKRNIAKLQLYKDFALALVTMAVLNFAWIYVEVYVHDSLSELLQVKWMIPGFWFVLGYALLVVICLFWPPNEKPARYLYTAEMEDEFEEEDEDEDLVLAEAGMKSENGRNVEREERKSLLEAFILLFVNIRER